MLGSVLGNNGIEGGDLYVAVFDHGGIARNNHALVGGIGVARFVGLDKRMRAGHLKTDLGVGAQVFQLLPRRKTVKIHAVIHVREGYGATECVTASCLTPPNMSGEGSIGVPFPDTYYTIVKPGTQEDLDYGEEGEICIAGPTVMLGYVGHPEETAQTKQTHADGLTWVYTGDLGTMDEQGFIYFRGRAKRMIVSSGYNVYPGQLENIIDANEMVQMSYVICIPDPYKMQAVKAFVMLKPGVPADEGTKNELLEYCSRHIAKYAMPKEIEFRAELPKTLVGKVAYRKLEEEEEEKQAANV